MAWYSRLKKFIDSVFHFDITSIRANSQNLKVKAKNSIVIINRPEKDPISIDKNGERITLNQASLDETQQKELGSIMLDYFNEEGELLKNNLLDYSGQMDEYKEEKPDESLKAFFKGKIPKEDLEILNISLFMRDRFKKDENISQIKSDIIKRFGDRGKNIANLCTTNYFENFIKPLWEAIHGAIADKQQADQRFNEIYELIVKNGLLAVFVHSKMSKSKLAVLIRKKMEESKKYGFTVVSDRLYIHALSRSNVKTVLECIESEDITANIVSQDTDFITVEIPIDDQ